MSRWLLLLVLAVAGCHQADADELLFGSPTGSGVVSIPFDATQSPGCMSWDGTNIDTHPSNPDCDGGSGSAQPTITPWDCGSGNGQRGYGSTPICFVVPTPDGGGAAVATRTPFPTFTPQPTTTPFDCGAGNAARGLDATPICLVVPTPDGNAGAPTAGTYIDVSGQAVSVDLTEIGDATIGDGTEAKLDLTCAVSGSGDPVLSCESGIYTIGTTGTVALALDDLDLANGPTSDAYLFASCTTGPECSVSLNHRVNGGGANETVLAATGTGAITLGDATDTTSITIATDGTGNDEVVLPNASIGPAELVDTYLTAEVDGSTTNELPIAGNLIDISGSPASTVDVDLTEATNVTWSANGSATIAHTFATSGSNDVAMTYTDAQCSVATTGNPKLAIDDADIANGGSPDFYIQTSCASGPQCSVTLNHNINSGTSVTDLNFGVTGAIGLGSASHTSITLATDGTGDGEVVLPNGAVGDAEVADDITIANTSSVSSSGNLVTTAGNVNINAGRLVIGLTPNHSCLFRDSSSDRLFADKDCDSTKDSGEEFIDYANTITSAFDLYVAKEGADAATCGPINDKCLTIGGAESVITTANDNGFATCSDNNALGCGRCCGDSDCNDTTTCNETSDCSTEGASYDCVDTVCQSGADSGKQCRSSADCASAATCSTGATASAACSAGTCTGPTKSYAIRIGAGRFNEEVDPPSPGSIIYAGSGRDSTMIYSSTSGIVFDVSSRTGVKAQDVSIQNWGAGDAWGSTGSSVANGCDRCSLVHWGAGWDINYTGSDNRTNVFLDLVTFGFTSSASGNSVHFQSKPYTCSNNAIRECTVATQATDCAQQCSGGSNDGAACTVASQCPSGTCPAAGVCTDPPSHDFGINGGGLQAGGSLGGRLVWFEGLGCGDSFNQFLDNVTITGYDGGGATGSACTDTNYQCGLVLSQTSCLGSANLLVRTEGLWLRGADSISGYTEPDRSLDVATNTTLAPHGATRYNACTRNADGTIAYSNASPSWGGGEGDLGELRCTEPPDVKDGECWYDTTQTRRECRINAATLPSGRSFEDGDTNSNPVWTFEGATADTQETKIGILDPTASGVDPSYLFPANSNCGGNGSSTGCVVPVRGTGAVVIDQAGNDAGDISLTTSPTSAATLVGTGRTLTGGTGISIAGSSSAQDLSADRTLTIDMTEVGDYTLGPSGATRVVTIDTTGTDPVWTYTSASANLSTGTLKQGGTAVMVPGATSTDDLDLGSDTDASVTWRMQLSGVAASAEPRFTFSSAGVNVTTSGGGGVLQQEGVNVCTISGTQTLTNKTLTTPTIGDLSNATHTHISSATGGQLTIPQPFIAQLVAPSTSATNYWLLSGTNTFQTSAASVMSVPTTTTVKRLYCNAVTAPDNGGGTQSYAMTLFKNGSAQSVTCTISEAGTTCNDTSNSFTITAGDTMSIRSVPSGTPAAALVSCAFQLDVPLT